MKKILTFFLTLFFTIQLGYCGINFDGTDDVVVCGTGASCPTTISVSFFHKWDGVIAGQFQAIYAKRDTWSATDMEFQVYLASGANDLVIGSAVDTTTIDLNFTSGTWEHICITYNESTGEWILYENGSQTATGTDTLNIGSDTTAKVYIGDSGNHNDEVFDGIISELAVWNIILTPTEVALLGNSKLKGMPLQIQTANLVSYWPLDEGTHGNSADLDTAWDISGNGNNGNPDNGANNTGLTWSAEVILDYPSPIIGAN